MPVANGSYDSPFLLDGAIRSAQPAATIRSIGGEDKEIASAQSQPDA